MDKDFLEELQALLQQIPMVCDTRDALHPDASRILRSPESIAGVMDAIIAMEAKTVALLKDQGYWP